MITVGRKSAPELLLAGDELLKSRGIDVAETERGGNVTYHGPGQLVGYPILDLSAYRKDLHWYLRRIEEVLLRLLARFGLPAFRVEAYTGVWTGTVPAGAMQPEDAAGETDGFRTVAAESAKALMPGGTIRKIASIGVRASRWITSHGFALNVTSEPLENFGYITPCGISGVKMTSLASEGARVTRDEAVAAVLEGFGATFPNIELPAAPEAGLRI